jgi:ribosomal protein S8
MVTDPIADMLTRMRNAGRRATAGSTCPSRS